MQLLRLRVELLGLLAEAQLGDLVRAGAVQVGGEHLAVAGVGERSVEHPAGLAREPLGGPGVAVVKVGDNGVKQLGRDHADRPQLVDGGQVDDVLANELLRALGQLQDLHPGRDPGLGPAECLRGTVLGEAAAEHRVDGLGLLVGAELLARDVLDRAVSVLGLGVADDDRDVGQPERPGGGDPVKAGDELEAVAVAVGADDQRDKDALQRDRAGERLDMCVVERAHVPGNTNLGDGDPAPSRIGSGGHQVLLHVWPAPLAGRSPPTCTPARACHPQVAGWPVSGGTDNRTTRYLRVSFLERARLRQVLVCMEAVA